MAGNYWMVPEGFERVKTAIRGRSLKGRVKLAVECGYRAHYAVYVHEDPFAHHPVGKWKFLEDPMRRGRGHMGKLIQQALRAKKSLESGILAALFWLEDASKEEVPVDTGFLRESWFVRLT